MKRELTKVEGQELAVTPPSSKRLHVFQLPTYKMIAINYLGPLAESLPFVNLTEHPNLDEILKSLEKKENTSVCENLTVDGGKICKRCRQIFKLIDMNQSYCKPCKAKRAKEYIETPCGHIHKLIRTCHYVDKKKGRECNITWENVIALLKVQKGLCYYSNAPLSFHPDSIFCVSIERVDNRIGHIIGNVVLVCNRFQSGDHSKDAEHGESAQWTRNKFFEAKRLRHAVCDCSVPAQPEKKKRGGRVIEKKDSKFKCTECDAFKDVKDFNKSKRTKNGLNPFCKVCSNKRGTSRSSTVVGLLQERRKSAKGRARTENVPYALGGLEAKDGLLQWMWTSQNGRGIYTQIPLCIIPTMKWVVSIERFHKGKGYVPDNIGLEVFEANTQKQWSKEFADMLWGPV